MVKELLYLEVLKVKCTHPLKYIAGLYTEHMLHSYNVHCRYGIEFQNDSDDDLRFATEITKRLC